MPQQLTVGNCLQLGKEMLQTVSENPVLETTQLLTVVLNKPRSSFYAWPEFELSFQQYQDFQSLLFRRQQAEPLAYLVGHCAFWSLELNVSQDTLIPRPETELLVETALTLLDPKKEYMIADLGTGSGAIGLALAHERPNWHFILTDYSHPALQLAKHNAARYQLSNVYFAQGDWCRALGIKKVDMIIANPPYISEMEWPTYVNQLRFEPPTALLSGADGLTDLKTIISTTPFALKRGGYLLLEHGFAQAALVRSLLVEKHYSEIKTLKDFAGIDRVTLGKLVS